jgi:acyl-homoserine lactone acylase PvdQ
LPSRRPALLLVPLLLTALAAPVLAQDAGSQQAGTPPTAEQRAAAPDAGAIRNILPPGARGKYTAADFARLQATGERPPNTVDQLELYDRLNTIAPQDVTPQVLQELFKDGALGVDPEDVVETVRPRDGVTVLRDRFGVPHVYGVTNEDTAFGAGYVGTQDRMFLQDALRHVGAARLTEFLGPSAGNLAMDRAQLRLSPYTVEEAEAQITDLPQRYPGEGEELQRRLDAFLEGINTAQREACPVLVAPTCPAEYAALQVQPRDWTRADVVYLASLVGGIFGSGGGSEYDNAVFLQQLQAELGEQAGRRTFDDLMEHDDPEAPTTIDTPFPYHRYGDVDPSSVRLPDPGAPTAEGSGRTIGPLPFRPPSPTGGRVQHPDVIDGPLGPIRLGLKDEGMSNALVVNASESEDGHPLAVFGPQVGYFAPQIVTEVDLHGPNYAARGASFAGTSFVVQLGHGVDYAWSATSANTDNVDTVAETLCNVNGTEPTVESMAYLDANGECVPFDRYTHRQVAKPSAGGVGPPQVVEMEVLRTATASCSCAPVGGRAGRLRARPHDLRRRVRQRGRLHAHQRPDVRHRRRELPEAFSAVDYTFNWFYVDSRDAGLLQQRAAAAAGAGLDPRLPRDAAPASTCAASCPTRAPAGGEPAEGLDDLLEQQARTRVTASDDQYGFGPVYRSLSLDVRLQPLLEGPQEASLSEVTGAMIDAATADPRGQQLLPELLAAVGDDPERARELALLREWQASGANRVDRDRDGAYAHEAAIALFDAWWEDAAKTVLRPVLGELVDEVPGKVDDHPRMTPGGFNAVGWYGYVDKDLRQVLGQPVRGPYSRTYCGDGVLEACRADLRASLGRAVDAVVAAQGTGDPDAWTYDKQSDRIRSSTLGLAGVPTFDFQNRPTFQQVASFSRSRADQPSAAAPPAAPPAAPAPAPGAAAPTRPRGTLAATGLPVALPLLAAVAVLGAAALRRRRP